jgi:hypothetical protein
VAHRGRMSPPIPGKHHWRALTSTPHPLAKLHRALGNPELFLYELKNKGSELSFMLIPISLPFLWLMCVGRPGIAVYDHAIFSLYSLPFMSLCSSPPRS